MNPLHWAFDKLYPIIRWLHERVSGNPWFDRVRGRLWIGGAPSYGRDKQFLLDHDIGAVLDMRAERQGDRAFYAQHDIEYLRLPVLDMLMPPADVLDRGVDFVQRQLEAGRSVLVHCAKGRGRSAAIVTAYLMAHEGLSYQEAYELLKGQRPLITLEGRHRRALENWQAARANVPKPPAEVGRQQPAGAS